MESPAKSHIGRKISRIRELRGMKQEALAQALGVSQQTVSNMENSEDIDDVRLKDVAEALGVSVEGLKNFSEEAVFNIIGNTVNNHDNAGFFQYQPNFNPLEKLWNWSMKTENFMNVCWNRKRKKSFISKSS